MRTTSHTHLRQYHYDVVEARRGHLLLRRSDGRWTVVRASREKGQVYSAMPGDLPIGGGVWYARWTDAGITYVANGYSEGYARRVFRRLVADAEDV